MCRSCTPTPRSRRRRPLAEPGDTIVFGVDPGSVKTGYGVLVRRRDRRIEVLDMGVIRTRSNQPLPERLEHIYGRLRELIEAHGPVAVVVEQAFVKHHPRSALILGHARGVALLAAQLSGAVVVEYAPADVKRRVAGSGRATKEQVSRMVCHLLGVREPPAEDAADALAAALCHALHPASMEELR